MIYVRVTKRDGTVTEGRLERKLSGIRYFYESVTKGHKFSENHEWMTVLLCHILTSSYPEVPEVFSIWSIQSFQDC